VIIGDLLIFQTIPKNGEIALVDALALRLEGLTELHDLIPSQTLVRREETRNSVLITQEIGRLVLGDIIQMYGYAAR